MTVTDTAILEGIAQTTHRPRHSTFDLSDPQSIDNALNHLDNQQAHFWQIDRDHPQNPLALT